MVNCGTDGVGITWALALPIIAMPRKTKAIITITAGLLLFVPIICLINQFLDNGLEKDSSLREVRFFDESR
jgi:hypothetical protein